MNSPVTNEACEERRCNMRKLIKDEVGEVMTLFHQNREDTNSMINRMSDKIDHNHEALRGEISQNHMILSNNLKQDSRDTRIAIDRISWMMVVMIISIALGAIGVKLNYI